MARQHVTKFVTEYDPQLVVIEQIDGARADDDEGVVEPQRPRVDPRLLVDVELGHLGDVEDARGVLVDRVDRRELPLVDPHRRREVHHAQTALAEEPEHAFEQDVEARHPAKRDQRGAIRRMFVRP